MTKTMPNKRIAGSPLAVQLHLTRKCNLECYYCGADEFRKREKEEELNTTEWINLLKRLKDIQVFDISLTGGEIFLREDIFAILETAVECGFPKIRLTTNGVLISAASAKRIKALNFKKIEVTLDGDEISHDRIRGTGSFAKAVEGIGHLVKSGVIPKIRFTPLKSNYKQLIDLVDMLYLLGIRELTFNKLHPTGRCNKIYKDIGLDFFVESAELERAAVNIREKYNDFKISDPDTFYKKLPVQYHESRLKIDRMNKQMLKPCSAAHSSCNITSSGWVIPCSEFFDFKGGNIREQDILDIWRNSENFE